MDVSRPGLARGSRLASARKPTAPAGRESRHSDEQGPRHRDGIEVSEVALGDPLLLRRGYAFPPSFNHLRIFAIRALVGLC